MVPLITNNNSSLSSSLNKANASGKVEEALIFYGYLINNYFPESE